MHLLPSPNPSYCSLKGDFGGSPPLEEGTLVGVDSTKQRWRTTKVAPHPITTPLLVFVRNPARPGFYLATQPFRDFPCIVVPLSVLEGTWLPSLLPDCPLESQLNLPPQWDS